jgi:ATP-binding cassette subfamily E protein 1
MNLQAKKVFAVVYYAQCDPEQCDPEKGICAAAQSCSYKVVKQIDGAFEPPMVFQDMCMGCWECIEACPLGAVGIKEVS